MTSVIGFDAHDDDPLASCELQDEDYYWFTAEVIASCARLTAARQTAADTATAATSAPADGACNPAAATTAGSSTTGTGTSSSSSTIVRYLSVLEGGYDLPALQRSAVCHVRALLEGFPHIPPSTPAAAVGGATASAGKEGEHDCGVGVGEGADHTGATVSSDEAAVMSQVRAPAPVDGEILALREYLEAFGIKDL